MSSPCSFCSSVAALGGRLRLRIHRCATPRAVDTFLATSATTVPGDLDSSVAAAVAAPAVPVVNGENVGVNRCKDAGDKLRFDQRHELEDGLGQNTPPDASR